MNATALYDPTFFALHVGILRATDSRAPANCEAIEVTLAAIDSPDSDAVSADHRRAVLNDPQALESLHVASRTRRPQPRSCLLA